MHPTNSLALATALLLAAPVAARYTPTAEPRGCVFAAEPVQTTLEVTVRGGDGQPVPGAIVRIADRAPGVTDSTGRTHLASPGAGTFRVTVVHSAFGNRAADVAFPADAGSMELRPAAGAEGLAATVQRVVAVAGVTGTAQRNPALESLGFYHRQETLPGQFVNDQEIQSRRAGRVTDILRRLKGIRVMRYSPSMTGMTGSRSGMDLEANSRIASSRGSTGISTAGPCWMDVYLDGVQVQSADVLDQAINLDQVPIRNVIAVEVYHPSEVPSEYRSSTSSCGVILIWTRKT